MTEKRRRYLIVTDTASKDWIDKAASYSGQPVDWYIMPLGVSGERYMTSCGGALDELESATTIDITKFSERAKQRLNAFYIQFISKLPRTPLLRGRTLFSELATPMMNLWWCMEISEKNPYRGSLIFKRLYFVALVKAAVENGHFDEIWVSLEDRLLSGALGDLHPASRSHDVHSKPDSTSSINQWFLVRFVTAAFRTFRRAVGLHLLTIFTRGFRLETSRSLAMLFTFYPLLWDRPYEKSSKDRMYGGLKEALERHTEVCYGAWVNEPLREAWRHRRAMKRHFLSNDVLVLNRLCKLRDFCQAWSIRRFFKTLFVESRLVPQIRAVFEDVDISPFVQEEVRRSFCRPEFFTNELLASAVARSIDRFGIRSIIHYMEFQLFEKAIWYGAHNRTKTIGFQHSSIRKDNLLYLFSGEEISEALNSGSSFQAMPFPDLIFTSGHYPFEVLRRNGIPEDRLAICGAVRYEKLASWISQMPDQRQLRRTHRIQIQTKVLLVASSSDSLDGAIDLIRCVLQSIPPEAHDVLVVIKCHPMLPIDWQMIDGIVPNGLLFEIRLLPADAPLLDFVALSDAVFQTGSSTAVEAAALGRIVVTYDNCAVLNLAPVPDVSRLGLVARTDEEMRRAVDKVLTGEVSLNGLRESSRCEVDEVFSYLDGTASDRFVQLLQKFGVLDEHCS